MSGWEQWLADEAAGRVAAGLVRRLAPRASTDGVLDLAGNDYLGLTRHPEVVAAARAAVEVWGAGAGASRLVSGTLDLHAELERALADFTGAPAALVTSTGYHANLAVVTALAGRDCLIVSDAHIHASLIDAARLSRAEIVVTPHNDIGAVAGALAGSAGRRTLVLAESVYSVLGDAAPVGELAELCRRHGALLILDEAHALGVTGPEGRGLAAEAAVFAGRQPAGHVVLTATLSKAFGAQGGAILGSPAIIDHLINRARPSIYDTGLAPAAAGAALAAIGILRREPGLPRLVADRSHGLAAALGVPPTAGAVVSVPMDSPEVALAAQARALDAGVRVGCFRPPSVPDGIPRLRVTCSAGPTDGDWSRAVAVLAEVVGS